ncbi:MAG: hypothetical protein M0Z59_03710 [Nitrospiraceae bacterium]|nr:hypothetical protein [Nitrospiraceae bacterium]
MRDLVGKMVEVGAIGLVYTGRLVEIGETDVHVESDSGFVAIPMDQVVFIRAKDDAGGPGPGISFPDGFL